MKKRAKSGSKHKDSALESGFTAFSSIGAFALSQLIEYPYIYLIVLIPLIICEGVLVGFFLLKIKRKYQPTDLIVEENVPEQQPKQKPKPKPKGIAVTKAEVVNDTLKFSVTKGFFKKRSVVIKEIPIYEIQAIENFGNELSVTWKGVTDSFIMEKKAESFVKLRDQIHVMIEEHQKTLEFNEKSALRKNELLGAINASIHIVDLSFDILISLQVKRINWELLEASSSHGFGDSLSFTGKTLPPLILDFSNISAAIKDQGPKETSKEAYEILKSIQGYFNGLNLDEDIKDTLPNFQNTKNAILAYYTLNDLLLGKMVGDKENKKENSYLETLLQNLAKETKVNVNFENLRDSIGKMGSEVDSESVIEDSREIFKEQLKNIDRPIEQLSTVQPPTEQAPIAQPESLPPPKPQEPTQPSTQQPAVEEQQAVQSPTEQAAIEQQEPMQPSEPQEPMMQPSTEPPVIEQQEAVQPSTEQPSVQQQEPTPTEATLPNSEVTVKPSEPLAKKKSTVQKLRKKILGY